MKSDWKQLTLGELSELIIDYRGKTPKKLGGDWANNGYRALSAKNIKTGRIVQPETIRFVNEGMYRKWMKDEIARGDILVTSEAPFGQIYYWNSDEKIVLSQRLFGVRINQRYDSKYIYYYMTTPDFQSELYARATGTTVVGLRQPELLKCVVRCPDIITQRKIAAILSALDDKIELNRRISANLEQQAAELYRERYETVVFDAKPNEWRVVTLGEVAVIGKTTFNPHKSPEILLEHYSIPAFDETRFPVFEMSSAIKSNKFVVDESCFLISKLNPTTKRVWRPYCVTENAVCSTEFIVYKAKKEQNAEFLFAVINSATFSDFMCSHVTGTTGSRQRTTPTETLDFEFLLPSDTELAEYQALVAPLYEQIKNNAIETANLKTLRDALLPRLMSGEIDVSDISL